DEDVKVSVSQSGVSDSVPAGASVTLQCSVLSESRAAELQVLWFRAAPPQSHPQIIYTHHNSGHQCESGSPTHTCVYNFSKNILSLSDTGTYYCAVAVCGKIIFGNGTRVQLDTEKSLDPVVICLAAPLGVCVLVIIVQTLFICQRRNTKQSHDKHPLDISVSQSSVSDSVPAGASVTLQCSVLSESRAAELQVLWFRAAPPQSHPQIIYTHHNSSHQCESGSPTHTCVYNFSKNILSLSDTGTYYCAVAACGKIIFGNGTRVQL
ncbi:putative immune-type receptor 15b precursor, partial [Clarias magur]